MFRRILVPIDGSHPSRQALIWAQVLASPADSEIFLLEAINPVGTPFTPLPTPPLARAAAREQRTEASAATTVLSNEIHALHCRGWQASRFVEVGPPAVTILSFIKDHAMDLVVMGTHGRSGLQRVVLGSVADEVRREAAVPVLLVPSYATPPIGVIKFLVCLDESRESESALDAALALASMSRGDVTLLEVVSPAQSATVKQETTAYLTGARQRAAAVGVKTDIQIISGDPGAEILALARALPADVIAMASQGRTGVARAVLGSVASHVVSHSHCPVLLTRRAPPTPAGKT